MNSMDRRFWIESKNNFCNFPWARMFNALLLPKILDRRLKMSKIKLLLISIGVSGLLFAGSVVGFGQQPGEPSYEVSLQLLLGSNDATQKGNLPANLSAVSQQIKSGFGMTNHRLVGTFLGRMGNSGNFSSKSGLNVGQQISGQPQSFLEWSIGYLKGGQGIKGYQAQSMSIQARVPVTTGSVKDRRGEGA